jgi:hypothetical protein
LKGFPQLKHLSIADHTVCYLARGTGGGKGFVALSILLSTSPQLVIFLIFSQHIEHVFHEPAATVLLSAQVTNKPSVYGAIALSQQARETHALCAVKCFTSLLRQGYGAIYRRFVGHLSRKQHFTRETFQVQHFCF